jgi:MHS family proline/betaine transporter-like MFS transporter
MTFVCQHSPDRRRGFFVSFLDLGSYLGFAAGAAVVSVLQLTLGQEQMEAWGWRIPFLAAGPLGIIALYFRMKIEESATFQATLEAELEAARHPETGEVMGPLCPMGIIKAHWRRPIVLAMILAASANTVANALTSYMPTYPTSNKGYDEVQGTLLTIPLWIGAISMVVLAIPCGASGRPKT